MQQGDAKRAGREPEFSYRFLTAEIRRQIEDLRSRYPEPRAILTQALWLLQEAHGYLPREAQRELARYLDVPAVWVHELVTFYHMYHEEPLGTTHILFCCNLSCSLRGALPLYRYLWERLDLQEGPTTRDGKFTVERVACLGACELAPVIQVNGRFVGPVDRDLIERLVRGTLSPEPEDAQ